ncbi:hypothetical protein HOA59_00745 [archaeon]|nr:hypothetical protein [archaeon]MBT6823947.1 hypothetical protein [archaeon]MBT7107177.1 hypothetical protein [archaeon]MBT7297753.1 hypothetical protein [archaeon]
MLPEMIRLKHLDEGIMNLVIDINRIPDVHTLTNCEGHIWRDCPAWPTKDGWLHFLTEKNENKGLLNKISEYCSDFDHMSIDTRNYTNRLVHTISAGFEPHHTSGMENIFEQMSKRKQEEYFKRADVRKEEILNNWSDLNGLVRSYIKNNISEHVDSLRYR